jgi:hypothetical protein
LRFAHPEAATSENAVYRFSNSFAGVYDLRFPVTTAMGTATVLSAWIIRRNEDFPRLVTCFIL